MEMTFQVFSPRFVASCHGFFRFLPTCASEQTCDELRKVPIQDKTDPGPGPERPTPGGGRQDNGGWLPPEVTFKLTNAATAVSGLLCSSEVSLSESRPIMISMLSGSLSLSPLPPAVRVVLPLFAFKFY